MIWIDSSFAIEWLLGTPRAEKVKLGNDALGILPAQYAETFTFFLKKDYDPLLISQQLEALELKYPEKIELKRASFLYLEARQHKSKASLADAILAAVAQERKEKIASFDDDFSDLGLKQYQNFWEI